VAALLPKSLRVKRQEAKIESQRCHTTGSRRGTPMSLHSFSTIAFSILFVVACSSAQAQPKLPSLGDDTSSETAKGETFEVVPPADKLVELIKKAPGYSNVEIIENKDKKKMVRAKVNEVTVVAVPLSCKEDKCKTLVFGAYFGKQKNVDLNWVNAWNADHSLSRAYLVKDEFYFDLGIHFWGGISPVYITETADVFGAHVKALFSFKP
jgi:hypothetical protein